MDRDNLLALDDVVARGQSFVSSLMRSQGATSLAGSQGAASVVARGQSFVSSLMHSQATAFSRLAQSQETARRAIRTQGLISARTARVESALATALRESERKHGHPRYYAKTPSLDTVDADGTVDAVFDRADLRAALAYVGELGSALKESHARWLVDPFDGPPATFRDVVSYFSATGNVFAPKLGEDRPKVVLTRKDTRFRPYLPQLLAAAGWHVIDLHPFEDGLISGLGDTAAAIVVGLRRRVRRRARGGCEPASARAPREVGSPASDLAACRRDQEREGCAARPPARLRRSSRCHRRLHADRLDGQGRHLRSARRSRGMDLRTG